MITVWGRRNSLNVQKVMWTLGELNLPYERHDTGGSFGTDDAYRQMNPNNVVPTIQDGELTLYESNACVRYLARQYGSGTLCPTDPARAALADQWMDWQCSTFSGAFFQLFFNRVRSEPSEKSQQNAARGLAMTTALMHQLESQLDGRDFLVGDALTMGDIPVACHLYRWFEMEIERPVLPNVRRYYERLCEREAYRYHVQVPFGRNPAEWLEAEQQTTGVQ